MPRHAMKTKGAATGGKKKKKPIKKMQSGAKTKMKMGGTKMTKGYARGGAIRRR
jgi:hypothetical protein